VDNNKIDRRDVVREENADRWRGHHSRGEFRRAARLADSRATVRDHDYIPIDGSLAGMFELGVSPGRGKVAGVIVKRHPLDTIEEGADRLLGVGFREKPLRMYSHVPTRSVTKRRLLVGL
jgi:hypothetical protein